MEYLFGDAGTRFGGLRVADGHPAPYRLPSLAVQVSNERCMSAFVSSLAQQMVAMEAVARRHGMGGKLQHVAAAPGYQHRDTHQDAGDRLSWLQLS